MKRAWALLFAALFILVSCADADDGQEAEAETDEPIIIGAALGFTGFLEPIDVPGWNAAQLAAEAINAEGGVLGRQLKLISSDTKSDKVQAGVAANQLLDEGADFILAPCDVDWGAAAAIAAQEREVPAFSVCAGTIQFGVQGIGPYAYTIGSAGASEIAAEAEWAYEEKGWRTAYVLQDDVSEYHKQSTRAFEAKWEMLSGTKLLGVGHFQQEDPSIASQITEIKSLSETPDFIVIASHPPGAITAIRQLRAAGVDIPLLGEGISFDGDYWKDSIPNISDFYYSVYASQYGDDPDPRVGEFIEEYEAEYGDPPVTMHAMGGYSAVEAFQLAAERAGSLDGPALIEEFDNFTDEELLIGPTTFTPDLHISVGREATIMETQNGETSFVTLWKPKEVPPVETWATD